ncbi:androgen-dependent TFPI-regulating protein-like isoform X3 [Hylaeus volcanicus]|uniref:androgen-dependent TFPI-regulating protein-like isoform X3 n=1 Tax=Hylaeus volcanicus TaxID=313075 RepID=UPI0023B80002|nr:androgen-dependent TFPI-regulating protein-like isoform X3 [Hylaeus volcanicus]
MAYTINQLFHTGMFLTYAFTFYSVTQLNIPSLNDAFKKFDPGLLKYLTMWGVIIQAVFFLICSLNDWFGTNAVSPKKPPFLRKLKDFMHAVFSFPVAMFVGVTFWSLMFVDRELVFPKAIDPYFPWWLNHLMHTMIMVSTLLETILTPRKYPSRAKGVSGHCLFLLAYLIWMHIIYYKSGIWVYPVMEVLSTPARIVFLSTMFLFSTMFYFMGETLDNFVWGNEYTKHKKSHAKSK